MSVMYELLFNYYSKLPDMCGEAPRLSRAKPNMNTWERIRNNILREELINKYYNNFLIEHFNATKTYKLFIRKYY